MKLLVVSDSHGLKEELKKIKALYIDQVDAMFHCGDSELHSNDEAIDGFLTVRGNCDNEKQFPLEIINTIGERTILVTHGHLYHVKKSLLNLTYRAEEKAADFVFFGHSHRLGAEKIGQTIFLNPGSIFLPRMYPEKSYAIIEIDNEVVTVYFYNDHHEEIEKFRRTFTL